MIWKGVAVALIGTRGSGMCVSLSREWRSDCSCNYILYRVKHSLELYFLIGELAIHRKKKLVCPITNITRTNTRLKKITKQHCHSLTRTTTATTQFLMHLIYPILVIAWLVDPDQDPSVVSLGLSAHRPPPPPPPPPSPPPTQPQPPTAPWNESPSVCPSEEFVIPAWLPRPPHCLLLWGGVASFPAPPALLSGRGGRAALPSLHTAYQILPLMPENDRQLVAQDVQSTSLVVHTSDNWSMIIVCTLYQGRY